MNVSRQPAARPGSASGKVTARKAPCGGCAERSGGFHDLRVNRLEANVDIDDHQRQQELDHPDVNRKVVVEQRQRLGGQAEPEQQRIQQPLFTENRQPRHRSDDVTDPRWKQEQDDQHCPASGRHERDVIGWAITDDRANQGHSRRKPQGFCQNNPVERVAEKFAPIRERWRIGDRAGRKPGPERKKTDAEDRREYESDHAEERWRQQRPGERARISVRRGSDVGMVRHRHFRGAGTISASAMTQPLPRAATNTGLRSISRI